MRLCAEPTCATLVETGRCPTHQRTKEQRRYNTDTRKWYYTKRWQLLRAYVLHAQPWCVHCWEQRVTTASTEVDHIVPHRGDPERFWDSGNLQALCKSCHSQKTQAGG